MSLAKAQAEAVASAISARWPQWSGDVSERLSALLEDIDELDRRYKEFAMVSGDRQLTYSHPVYQYFERAYGLPGHSLHWEPEVMPSEAQWQELSEKLQPQALFIWEAEPAADIAAKMNALGLPFVVISPGANRSETDWLSLQGANVSRLQLQAITGE